MLGWLRRKARQEQIKLLFQNNYAAEVLAPAFELMDNYPQAERIKGFEARNRRIALMETVDTNDLKTLLHINSELRKLYWHAVSEGPEAKLRQMFGQPPSTVDFDAHFKPLLGWDEYYKDF